MNDHQPNDVLTLAVEVKNMNTVNIAFGIEDSGIQARNSPGSARIQFCDFFGFPIFLLSAVSPASFFFVEGPLAWRLVLSSLADA